MGRVEQITQTLRSLEAVNPEIQASALLSDDGLMIASALPERFDEARVAGICATLSTLGARASAELGRGDVREVMVNGDDGYALMLAVGAGALLVCLTSPNSKLGLVFLDMRRAVDEVRRVL